MSRRGVSPHPAESLRDAVAVTAFWGAVQRGGEDDCWPWTGYAEGGYGLFFWHGRMYGAHELALSFTTGEERHPTLDTCHSCNNPPCCNPAHLRFDTRASNVADAVRAGTAAGMRLSNDEVRLVRERRAAGASQQDLADQFGVSVAWVSGVVNGTRRPEAGGPIATKRNYHRKALT